MVYYPYQEQYKGYTILCVGTTFVVSKGRQVVWEEYTLLKCYEWVNKQ